MKGPRRGRDAGPDGLDGEEEGYGLVFRDELFDVAPAERIERWNSSAYFRWMGLELTAADGGRASAVLPIRERHRGGGGTPALNGGVIAYAFDGVLGAAIASLHRGRPQATLQLTVTYLHMLTGGCATWEAEVVRAGRTMAICEGRVRDEGGRVCATAQCICRLFATPRPAAAAPQDDPRGGTA